MQNKGIQVHFKGSNTVKTLLMAPKDRDHKLQKSGIIYKFKCPHINCPKECIGESGRTSGNRVKEHLRPPSPIHQHSNTTEHPVSPDCFTIVHRESQGNIRNIKEAMFIYVNNPSLDIMWVNTSCRIYGITYCRRLQLFHSGNNQYCPLSLPIHPY